MTSIKALNLTKTFKNTTALNNISFNITSGQITGLVGPDGAGKTTLIRLIAGLLKYDSGELFVLDERVPSKKDSFLEHIGYMPQKFGLYEDLSVDENMNLYANLQEVDDKKTRITPPCCNHKSQQIIAN
jgi:ABC-2 type transport system ATP-binding protein